MAFTLPALPFAPDALAPHMSAETLQFHHGKHHAAYVKKANELVAGTPHEGKSLEEVIRAAKQEGNQKLFNNAAQHWNHSFFWQCLSPKGGKPGAALQQRLDSEIGGKGFAESFTQQATDNFGSGWTWLVLDQGGKLAIRNTGNADLPLVHGETALLTLDVWEHAYYIDYRNERPRFIKSFLDNLVNWAFVEQTLAAAGKAKAA